jgi:hypothetical protein
VPSTALQRELDAAAGIPRGAAARAKSARGGARWAAVGLLVGALLAVGVGVAALLWDRGEGTEPPQPAADPARARWVRLRATLRADASDRGGAWDLDGSPPDLRARIHVRDEVVELGPCRDSLECVQSWERVRLIPGVPFRVRVDDMEGPFANALGAAWVRWDGRSGELVRAKLGAVTLELRVDVEAPAPPPPPLPLPTSPRVTSPSSAMTRDAGARPRGRPSTRTRRPRREDPDVKPDEVPDEGTF